MSRKRKSQQSRGHAVIEVSLMAPWIFFLFMGTVGFGFYASAAIATQNAAREAVDQTSANTSTAADATLACDSARQELKSLPNMAGTSGCAVAAASVSQILPVAVTAAQVVGPDSFQASQVSVTYQTIPMIPMPGLMGQMNITRTAVMRIKDQ
ncbi:MAG: hypothetical protein DMG57_13795 [Acidobacteria bacterium]|nr:MAG: hypothetical protein DMG57_13795 [Acidobacteriota bacterium]